MTTNEAAERLTPHIFADDSIDADGAYCTRHEHWVSRNPTNDPAAKLRAEWDEDWMPESLLDEALAAEHSATVERIREQMITSLCTCGFDDGKHRPTWKHCAGHVPLAILDEEGAR